MYKLLLKVGLKIFLLVLFLIIAPTLTCLCTGRASTDIDGLHYSQHRETERQFLCLRAQLDESLLPASRVFEAGRKYTLPFSLTVPDRISQQCQHPMMTAQVRQSHQMLPPSLDPSRISSSGDGAGHDAAPSGCKISYCVRAAIMRADGKSDKATKSIVDTSKSIRIIPITEEQSPSIISTHENEYCEQQTTPVTAGLLHGQKLGQLTAATTQPSPIQLQSQSGTINPAASSAVVHLQFDAVGDHQPPQMTTISTELRATTVFSAADMCEHPSTLHDVVYFSGTRDMREKTIALSKQCAASTKWTKHQTTITSSDAEAPSAYYTASIEVPLTLPSKNSALVPSFHSCLISRIYSLDLTISYQNSTANSRSSKLKLSVPIQVMRSREIAADTHDKDFMDLDEKQDLDAFAVRSPPPCPPYAK